jgi:pSer/pThr/pTyr-binding forkhead associated (FHA) protein
MLVPRFYRPPEGTLQMLPGRLEIVDGEDRGQAIRFVKTRPGTQQITFGRREGVPYEHIQLRAPTVSRQHARLDFEHGHWNIANLSETNPVQINGEALFPGHGTRPLEDGDRIEMGEVVFRFKER